MATTVIAETVVKGLRIVVAQDEEGFVTEIHRISRSFDQKAFKITEMFSNTEEEARARANRAWVNIVHHPNTVPIDDTRQVFTA